MYLNYTQRLLKLLKTWYPIGELGESGVGNTFVLWRRSWFKYDLVKSHFRYRTLDMQPQYLEAEDNKLQPIKQWYLQCRKYKIGDLVSFKIKYMGALLPLNSDLSKNHRIITDYQQIDILMENTTYVSII
jgi:hypothetical protein